MNRVLLFITIFILAFLAGNLAAQDSDCDPPEILCPTTPFEVSMCGAGEVCIDLPVIESNSPVTVIAENAVVDKRASTVCYPVNSSGTYVFVIIAQNECGADTCEVTAIVTINEPPVIDCPSGAVPVSICEPGPICLDLPIADADEVSASGGEWTEGAFCFNADTSGTYTYLIEAANGCGTTGCEFAVNVEIVTPPVIDCPLVELSETICGPGEVCVELAITNYDEVQVDGDAVWSDGSLCFDAQTSGFYTFTVTSSNECFAAECALGINVMILEAPFITCPVEPVEVLVCEGAQAGVYLPINNPGEVKVMPESAGNYWQSDTLYFDAVNPGQNFFTVVAENQCGSDTCELTATVEFGTVPMIACPEDTLELLLCEADTVCIELPVENPGTVTIQGYEAVWENGLLCFEPAFPMDQNITTYYDFTIIAADFCGADTCNLVAAVETVLAPQIDCPEDTLEISACAGTTVEIPAAVFHAETIDILGGEYEDGIVSFTADTSQLRHIRITAINACSTNTCEFYVDLTVLHAPAPDFSIDSTSQDVTPVIVYFRNDTEISGDITFVWNFGDGQTSTEFAPAHAYDSNGCYDVSLEATNQCGGAILIKEGFVCITDAQVVIPTPEWISIYCGQPALDDQALQPGDIISAYDPDGVLCGMGTVRQDGSFGFLPIYRDDATSPDLDEGAEPGDPISLEINFDPVFTTPRVIWTENGDRIEVCDFSTEKCSPINITMGWSLVSWNNTYTAEIEEFVDLIGGPDCVRVILGFDQSALTYNPDLPEFSTLDHVDYYHGYWIYGECLPLVAPQVCGGAIDPQEYIPVYDGWNLVAVWLDAVLPVEDAWESIFEILMVALGYHEQGVTWMPDMGEFNTLTEIRPIYGYWAKVSENGILAYPGFGIPPVHNLAQKSQSKGVRPTRQWINIYGDELKLDDRRLPSGTEIEIRAENGILCGSAVYNGELLKFTPVYGYDGSGIATADYPQENAILSIYIDGQKVYPEIAWTELGDCIEVGNLFSKPGGSSPTVPDEYSLSQNYPNPFNPNTVISFELPTACNVELSVFNLLGQRVASLVNGYHDAGIYESEWDGTDDDGNRVSSGIYLYRIKAGNFVQTKKMLLAK
ncbi:MAG TPA: T9SS type A sorting domain-containing protein [candidate division Zixibacteria bacterium]|nr:T9SS type A sorting domain-containing protein [candidate division Zixibacteria bacterium]